MDSQPDQPGQIDEAPRFGEIVRRCRDDLGLSQGEFATLLGMVRQQQVGRWERGIVRSQPRREALLRLSEVCRVAPGALLEACGFGDAPPELLAPSPLPRNDDPTVRRITEAARLLSARQRHAILVIMQVMAGEE